MPGPASPRLFLVDGYALIYRAFFALGSQPLLSSKGENTSIALGAHDFLKKLIEKHKPDYLGWVHDAGLSFRHERYPAYKATRERLEPALQADFDTGVERITQILEAYRVPVLSLEGYEADDVIGTLARQAARRGINAVIVSGDKDFVQLVGRGIWILNPWHGRPGFTTEKWYDADNASERLGVPPERVTDYLALLGDTSDNIPGVKGIGEKTALQLIQRWGPLEEIIAHVDAVEPTRARNALMQFGDNGVLSKELLTIKDDLPITLDLEALALQRPDWNRLRDLFVELEFRTNAQEAATQADAEANTSSTADDTGSDASPGPSLLKDYHTIDTVEDVNNLIAAARRAPFIAVDTETVLDVGAPPIVTPMRANLVGISMAIAPGEAFYLPFAHCARRTSQGDLSFGSVGTAGEKGGGGASIAGRLLAEGPQPVKNLPPLLSDEMAPLRALLADVSIRKTAHNAKYDLLVLRRAGVELGGLDFDSMLASYVLDPGRRSHGIDALAIEFLQTAMTSYSELTGKGKQQIPFDEVPVSAARDYSCADADVAFRLRVLLEPRLDQVAAAALLHEVELPLVSVLAEMEWHGMTIDVAWFHSLKSRFAKERERLELLIYEAAGGEFNINSNKQLATILFGTLALPVKKKTSTGPSTDASVLQELADEGHPLPALMMEYREVAKLESTYLDTLPALVNPRTKRLHTSFQQTVASTGRLASSDPNLQNIPIRKPLGKEIRRGFIPQQGWQMLAADYSQVELRLLAHLSHDSAFVEAFKAGGDIHRQTAAVIFGVPLDAVTGEMRARAKTINFATIYGQGAHSLSRQLKVEHAEAKAFIEMYFERFSGVRAFLDQVVEQAKERGYVETIFHRRRYIPELKDRNFNIRAFGERTAQNSPIQGSAADLIKIAMIHIDRALRAAKMESRMLLQVHDELVFECPHSELGALRILVEHEMTTAIKLDVPLVVEIGVGSNWLETKV
jgi:DNA polymerase-1